MVARVALAAGLFSLCFALPLSAFAQEEGNDGGEIIPEIIINDDSPETPATSMSGEPTGDGGDVATVINPEAGSSGKVVLVKDNDEYVDVMRSGALVERVPLVSEDGCLNGLGQIGSVSFCGGSAATLDLIGRPPYNCPQNGAEYGPCEVQGS